LPFRFCWAWPWRFSSPDEAQGIGRFDDGVQGTVDFADWLVGPVFEPLKDRDYCARFCLEGGTVAWPNGADIAPETLHERAKGGRGGLAGQ
jgi:hypothetical protein